MNVTEYIENNILLCVRENKEDKETLIGLPYPYTVLCLSDDFQEMYYWDTYFLNKGLILSNKINLAKNNVDNMLYLVDRYGFMPNGSRTFYLNNSQPPFLSEMVKDIYEATGNKEWLAEATRILVKEYDFWIKKRTTEIGLAQYTGYMDDFKSVDVDHASSMYIKRIKHTPDEKSKEQIAKQARASFECGWDMSARFGFDIENYVQVDLNSLLCAMERNIGYFLNELNQNDSIWTSRYEQRLSLMRKYMLHDNVFCDYNFKSNAVSELFSCANIYPMWLNLLTDEEAKKIMSELHRIEAPYGLYAAERSNEFDYNFQWSYPNGWAPLYFIAIEGFLNYGYIDKALELAKKYLILIEKNFDEHHDLFEKYNVEDGSLNAVTEGNVWPRPMMGWTAGVYLYAKSIVGSY